MTPDVVIVGAGVIGASCAVHLARAGARVVLLDRLRTPFGSAAPPGEAGTCDRAPGPAAGSTGRATGGFRAQFATAIDIRLSLLARARLLAFADDTGVDPGFVQVGYLWLARSEVERAELARANALQHREGLQEATLVGPDDIAAINPHVALAGVVGGAWCPTDGVLRPTEILRGYLETAARLGVAIHWRADVTALERAGDRIVRVRTTRGDHPAGLVVNAAGAWAAPVAALAGVDVPVVPLRRQVAITEPTSLPETTPLTIWLGDGFHFRVRDGRVLLLLPTPGDPDDPYCDRVESRWLDTITALAAARIPALRAVSIDRAAAWAGLYEVSPDRHAILGFAPGCPNLMLVNGSSGHGVMHAPALGQLAAELATGAAPALAVHVLRPSRFAEGEPVAGSSLL